MIYHGGHNISSLHYGGTDIAKVYHGAFLVWQACAIKGTSTAAFTTYAANGNTSGAQIQCGTPTFEIAWSEIKDWTSMADFFNGKTELATIDMSGCNTFKIISMVRAFKACMGLTSADLSNCDLTCVNSCEDMFYGATNLVSVNLSGVRTSALLTDISYMFSRCNSLTTITGLSGLNVSSVTTMKKMFIDNLMIETLDLSGWNTGNLTNMYQTFRNCARLTSINFDGWDFSKVTDFGGFMGLYDRERVILGTFSGISVSLSFETCRIDSESVTRIVNGLARVTTTQTITFYRDVTLTNQQRAIATSKGWTVASA